MSAKLNLDVRRIAAPRFFFTLLKRSSSSQTSPLIYSSDIFFTPTIKNDILDNAGFPLMLIFLPVEIPFSSLNVYDFIFAESKNVSVAFNFLTFVESCNLSWVNQFRSRLIVFLFSASSQPLYTG